MKVQATLGGYSGSYWRHQHDVFDIADAAVESGPWPTWLRRVPADTPTITNGAGGYYEKQGVAYITCNGEVVARFAIGPRHIEPQAIETAE